MKKSVVVKTTPDADLILDLVARQRHKKEYRALYRSIEEKKALLEKNPLAGEKMQQDRIPREYIVAHRIDNLWKINLAGHWRMLYTLKTNQVEILAIVLDIMDHPAYDRKLGYRKK